MGRMRANLPSPYASIVFCLSAALTGQTLAQTPSPVTGTHTSGASVEQKTEHITHEDGGSRVDEVRVGGITRQIDVQTKSGLPAYQVQPTTNTQGTVTAAGERSGSQGSAGRASWRLLNF